MPDIRVSDITAGEGEVQKEEVRFVALRCQEPGCNRLLIRVTQATGQSIIETHCTHCQTWAEWTLRAGQRPLYTVRKKRV